MKYLPRYVPDDKDIIEMIRTGVNTVPMMTEKTYGSLQGNHELWCAAKSRIFRKVAMLAKYGIVRDAGTLPYSHTKIWEVVE